MGSNHMHNMFRKSKQIYNIPEYDPQTGERNPHWDELMENYKLESTSLPPGISNVNEIPLDTLVDMLEVEISSNSINDVFTINKLIEFYRKNK